MDVFEKLANVLERELSEQERLLELLVQERAAIVKVQSDKINEINLKKEDLLVDAKQLEVTRSSLLVNIAANGKKPKLSEVISQCESVKMREKLSRIGMELRSLASTVQQLNSQNSELVRHSLGIVSSALAIFESSAVESDLPSYGKSGELTDARASGRTRSSA